MCMHLLAHAFVVVCFLCYFALLGLSVPESDPNLLGAGQAANLPRRGPSTGGARQGRPDFDPQLTRVPAELSSN